MKSKYIFAVGALTGVIVLSTPVFAGPLGGIAGSETGSAGIGGFASGALSAPMGAPALAGPSATFGAAGNAGAMASGAAGAASMGNVGAAATGNFAGNAAGAANAGPGTAFDAAAGAAAHGREAGAALRNTTDDSVEAGTTAAALGRTAAHAASSRLIHKAGKVSGSAHGGVSASGTAQASGGSNGSVGAQESANSHLHADASTQ